jgi:hypothetical protein
MYLSPKGFRGDRPGWFVCNLSCKEIAKHRLSNCVRGGCPDYCERGEERVADRQKRINWDGPASETVDGASRVFSLREWAEAELQDTSLAAVAKRIGCSWGSLQSALKKTPAQAGKPTRKATSASCEDETQPEADQPLADSGPVTVNGAYNVTVVDTETETPCPEPVVMCWNCGARPAVYESSDDHPRCHACYQAHQMVTGLAQQQPVTEPLIADGVTREATLGDAPSPKCSGCRRSFREAEPFFEDNGSVYCKGCFDELARHDGKPLAHFGPAEIISATAEYLKYLWHGEQECYGLTVWLACWKVRGEAA